ncbi:hypothetical protein PAAG_12262 [Paracoccidioides lutzii Pb01]|uniref:Uncharacterized protein n=1 Tax=Paracoccidioides lutzii (strain ATCC MYA-826 / Pb01) TaxID=502779 RepID=A0A0A2V0N9_PARBA|nr:hypothetical protein PAAG_12262 [Paracoccidioides lutzii Pb01]KGQ01068.1 hypothetical protein PAAG_12262 [Paracoccidioides lutzii Pb01]
MAPRRKDTQAASQESSTKGPQAKVRYSVAKGMRENLLQRRIFGEGLFLSTAAATAAAAPTAAQWCSPAASASAKVLGVRDRMITLKCLRRVSTAPATRAGFAGESL